MENTNNKIEETKFTQNDVLKGLLALDEETVNSLPQTSIEKLIAFVNDEDEINKYYMGCDAYIMVCNDTKKAISELITELHRQKEKGCEQ